MPARIDRRRPGAHVAPSRSPAPATPAQPTTRLLPRTRPSSGADTSPPVGCRCAGSSPDRSSNSSSPIRTSSPGSNPARSSAAITPISRRRCSRYASASRLERSWRATSISIPRPATRNASLLAHDVEAAVARPACRRDARPRTPARGLGEPRRGRARPGRAAKIAWRSSSSPTPVAEEIASGRVPDALAQLAPQEPLALVVGQQVGLGDARRSPAARPRPGAVLVRARRAPSRRPRRIASAPRLGARRSPPGAPAPGSARRGRGTRARARRPRRLPRSARGCRRARAGARRRRSCRAPARAS